MKKLITFALIPIAIAACSGNKPFTANDNPTTEEILEGRKPIYSSDRKKKQAQQQTIIYSPYPQGSYPSPVNELPAGALSFEQWKRAKENNTQEYREFVEYQEYLKVLQSQQAAPEAE